jgi:UDP-2-acetamido-3-amino-2,3-dideoxy-glucuronate N-acetyltransferase
MTPWLKGIVADVHPTVKFGENSFVWSFVVMLEGTVVGDNCVIGSGCYIGRNCKIGNGVRIQDKCHITDGVVMEDNVFIGPGVMMTDDKYPVVLHEYNHQPPYFEEGCSVGAGAVILPGVRVGRKAMVGAGAVVTRDVAPYDCVIGVPARVK